MPSDLKGVMKNHLQKSISEPSDVRCYGTIKPESKGAKNSSRLFHQDFADFDVFSAPSLPC